MLGSLSLDFLDERLDDRQTLADALVGLDVLSFEPAVRPEDLSDARLLQAVLRRSLTNARVGEELGRDLVTLNSFAADELPTIVLQPDLTAARTAADPVRSALAAIARDGIETIARHQAELRLCQGEGCGRPFLDLSRAKGRRWCSMTRCGNRVKVAAFRRRQMQTPRAGSS